MAKLQTVPDAIKKTKWCCRAPCYQKGLVSWIKFKKLLRIRYEKKINLSINCNYRPLDKIFEKKMIILIKILNTVKKIILRQKIQKLKINH